MNMHQPDTICLRAVSTWTRALSPAFLVLAIACESESAPVDRTATDLDLTAFGVQAMVPDDEGYRLLAPDGAEIGRVDVDVDEEAGSVRVTLADETAELDWTDEAARLACDAGGSIAGDVEATLRGPLQTVSDACAPALAIASEIAATDELDVPWTTEPLPAELQASIDASVDDAAFRDTCEINYISGCINWNIEQGCVDWMLCAVYDCVNPNFNHYLCFINW